LREGAGRRTYGTGSECLETMASATADREKLELLLLRRGIGALEADRTSCADCGRTPLVGEQVYVYGGRRPRTVCELCSTLRQEEPQVSAAVRHAAHGRTVRVLAPAA
jgi:hypothetical protein